jgi:hypothetical protein
VLVGIQGLSEEQVRLGNSDKRERDRETERQRERETERQRDRETEREKSRDRRTFRQCWLASRVSAKSRCA